MAAIDATANPTANVPKAGAARIRAATMEERNPRRRAIEVPVNTIADDRTSHRSAASLRRITNIGR
jgi:hypothetical protein